MYIGRATSLRDRVRSYFSPDLVSTRGPRIADMVSKSDCIGWTKTDSVLEAVIAEANLIKKYWPDYNIKEKDDRSFNYVVITSENFPRVIVLRGRNIGTEKEKHGLTPGKVFGPFPNGSVLREALRIVRRLFPFVERNTLATGKYRFYRQLGLAPDISSKQAESQYQKTIKHIILFFEGKKNTLISKLEKEMAACARRKQFEFAGEIKKKLFALYHIRDVALVKEDARALLRPDAAGRTGGFRIEAYDIAHMSGKKSVGAMTVVCDGETAKNEYRKFKLSPEIGNNDPASLREVLVRRFRHVEWTIPDLVVVDGGRGQLNVAQKVLGKQGFNIPAVSVVKDDGHRPNHILGDANVVSAHQKAILLANAESHRFAVAYHRKLRRMRN